MELDEFIKTTLSQIARGVKEAKNDINCEDIIISPRTQDKHAAKAIYNEENISFDIAITISNEKTIVGGGKISVAAFGANRDVEKNNSIESITRIKFSIPIAFKSQGWREFANNTELKHT